VRLSVETAIARAAGRVSRLTGRGGGTTLPGKLLTRLDPGALSALAARLPAGCVLVSATNGKTTTTGMVAEILRGRHRLAHNRTGANLVSGVASALLADAGAELGLFEVDEAALGAVAGAVRPRALLLGNLFRDQLDRYGELELVAERWRDAVAALPAVAAVVVNADDPALAALARERPGTVWFGLDDPAAGQERLAHAADSKYCLRCSAPLDYAPAYAGHLGAWRCPACGDARPRLEVRAERIELDGTRAASFSLAAGDRRAPVELALPGLYNVYNAGAAAALACALGVPLADVAAGLGRFTPAFGRVERVDVGGRRLLLLLIKNPAGANEVVRMLAAGGPQRAVVVALNDGIADGRDVSWIWDVDFEPLGALADRLVVTGRRAEELALRFVYGGLARERVEVEPDLARAIDRGLALVPEGGELAVLPTYTAMLELQALLRRRGIVRPYWQ
jgi:UDP-N-acetylmuramyl tripeptide synthase